MANINSLFDDSQFDPATFGPQGSFIDQILANPALQGALPSQPMSMDANASMPAAAPQPAAPAQPQASPIPIGDYRMPRVGPAAAFQLPEGELDPETGEHVAPAPQPQQPTPANPLSNFFNRAADGFNRAADGLESIAHGGSLLGVIRGQPTDARSVQQQQLQKQYNAYIGTGVFTPQEAQIATINPEAAKVLIAQKLGKDKVKFAQLKDGLGGDHPAFINEDQQTINGQSIADYNKQNASNNSGGLGDTSKTGAEYLATIPPKERGIVQSMVDGRQPMPSSFALAKPYWQNMIAAANNYDPTFDQTTWPARVKGMTSFKSGADAGTVRSANQVLGHISDLTDKADELHNSDYPMWNYAKNTWNSQTGSDAANNWVTQAHAVADELSAFMKGAGHSSDTEIQQWKESLSPNMSPQQQRGAIKTLMGIYDHALSALEDKRTGAIGPIAAGKLGPLVTTAGKAAMDKVRKWAAGSDGAPGAPAINPSAVEAEMKRRGLL